MIDGPFGHCSLLQRCLRVWCRPIDGFSRGYSSGFQPVLLDNSTSASMRRIERPISDAIRPLASSSRTCWHHPTATCRTARRVRSPRQVRATAVPPSGGAPGRPTPGTSGRSGAPPDGGTAVADLVGERTRRAVPTCRCRRSPGMSQVLQASGLIASERSGGSTCRIEPRALRTVEQRVTERRTVWERRFNRLGRISTRRMTSEPRGVSNDRTVR